MVKHAKHVLNFCCRSLKALMEASIGEDRNVRSTEQWLYVKARRLLLKSKNIGHYIAIGKKLYT